MSPIRMMGIVVLAAIGFLSLLPEPWKGRTVTFGAFHDCAHIAAFLVAFVLITWQVRSMRLAVRAAFLLLAFGGLLEFFQTRVYGNHLEYQDIVADAAGLAIGLLVLNLRQERYD
jgi:VanZ family protein